MTDSKIPPFLLQPTNPQPIARRRRARGRRGGVAIVEFALVVPMLLLLTMGMVQGGIILNARLSLSNAVRDVGRFASINATNPGSDALIKDYAVKKLRGFNLAITPANVTIGPPAENTATVKTNRTQYVTELPIEIRCDISGRVFLPPNFLGAKMLPGGIVTVSTIVVCE